MHFQTNNARFLIFSDPHQDAARVEYLLKHENYDKAFCLGDWFDSFDYDTNDDVIKTCKLLENFVHEPNCWTLWGNHDLHYFYKSKHTLCSGYEDRKYKLVKDTLDKMLVPVRDEFSWYFWIDDWLCTHAGVNSCHFPPVDFKLTTEGISVWLNDQANFADRNLLAGDNHWFYRAGQARGGNQQFGGIVWQDFDCEFLPIPELKQLVGHTPHGTILNHIEDGNVDLTKSLNLDLDCHLNEYLIIENGKLEIKKYRNL